MSTHTTSKETSKKRTKKQEQGMSNVEQVEQVEQIVEDVVEDVVEQGTGATTEQSTELSTEQDTQEQEQVQELVQEQVEHPVEAIVEQVTEIVTDETDTTVKAPVAKANHKSVKAAPVKLSQDEQTKVDTSITKALTSDLISYIKALPTITVPLSDIRLDETLYQPRHGGKLDKRHLELLADSDMDNWTPVLLTPSISPDYVYDLVDGYHRRDVAYKVKQVTDISSQVIPADKLPKDASFVAAMINSTHGLTLSKKDRRNLTFRLHKSYPDLSLRALSSLSGLSHETIRTLLFPDRKKKAVKQEEIEQEIQELEEQEKEQEQVEETSLETTEGQTIEYVLNLFVDIHTNKYSTDYIEYVLMQAANNTVKDGYTNENQVADVMDKLKDGLTSLLSKFDNGEINFVE